MKTSIQLKTVLFFAIAFLFSGLANAQMDGKKAPASPRDSVSAQVGAAVITINYGSPSVKGRKIWGGLEAYGKVWRAGANAATTFTTNKDIIVEGRPLAAGKYAFFVTPKENGKWTVIFNKVANTWGSFDYDKNKAQDALKADVKVKTGPLQERLVYTIDSKGFALKWENIIVPVRIK